MSAPVLVQKTDAAAPLDLTIEREGVGGVTGKSPTVALRNAATVNSYLDWADGTFKTVGWTTKYATMTEVERGHYQRPFDATIATISVGMVLAAEYHVNDGFDIVGDAMDVLAIVEEIYDVASEAAIPTPPTVGQIADAVWDEALAGHLAVGSTGEALDMAAAAGSPEFRVEQAWTRSIVGGSRLRATVALHENGAIVALPGTARLEVRVYTSAGVLEFSQSDIVPNAQGFFAFEKDPYTPAAGTVLAAFAKITLAPGTHESVVGLAIADFGA